MLYDLHQNVYNVNDLCHLRLFYNINMTGTGNGFQIQLTHFLNNILNADILLLSTIVIFTHFSIFEYKVTQYSVSTVVNRGRKGKIVIKIMRRDH